MSKATPLELFAAFTAQFPLLTRADLEATVEDMRHSSGFARRMDHARKQAEAIGLVASDLRHEEPDAVQALEDEAVKSEAAEERAQPSGPARTSGFHALRRVAI